MKAKKNNWPTPMEVAPHYRHIKIDDLTATEKKSLSDYLKCHHPAKARELYTFLKDIEEDKFVQQLKAFMGASLVLQEEYVPPFLKKYLKN